MRSKGRVWRIVGGLALLLVLLVVVAWNVSTTVSVEHTFDAPAADVWRVWTDADSFRKWWGPKGYSGVVVRNDVRPGGGYLWAMTSGSGRVSWNTGTYQAVVADREIVSTMSFADERGRALAGAQVPAPGRWPDAITVIVEFRESAGKTTVTVREVGVPLIVYPLSKLGWDQQFGKIAVLL